ncbi:RagB/SusD family nutrient uptake outer membrane protein [Leeuwenhoekiella marinoflava]|uniref:Starch-binding associating with outer membrane n=2 Tax=Leeuwenhoekiella marinoflava TaxID=988 RepID=A0ABY1HPE8_9FLAO|nr:RagB/SusD family nutrient uptake outer membrane protein [Leeuwenhoekiella marinoflava]RXG31972.1 putative outer membrane starch-binding protein [Leeuwenhoekiella marinoflava]SHE93420.1 Starch-binding associating with outer membrane [Leeuwenhoekiella marinoflava DSM 3653]
MKYTLLLLILCASFATVSCNNEDWLERDPKNIITDEQLWNDPQLITSLLANYYDRLPTFHGVFNTGGMTEIDDAMWSGHFDQNWRNDFQYGYDYGRYWDYTFIRDINLALDNIETFSTEIGDEQKNLFTSELRFIRAFVYFELVKRMGGVPLVTEQLIYDFGGDPEYLQIPRSKEHEVYDFIYSELETIKSDLQANNGSQTRANEFTALALESRAMLYAASIAKYNNLMDTPINLPGGEVGIPAEMAKDYYEKSLQASQSILQDGGYALYDENPDKQANFYEMMMNKGNAEVIFAKDYVNSLKTHGFTFENIPRSLTEDNEYPSNLTPSLNLVESFDYLDGGEGSLNITDASGDPIVYEDINGIFANKDARLYGTVIYPGTTFKSAPVKMQAGVAVWNDSDYELLASQDLGSNYSDEGLWTGADGPQDNTQFVSNTGFYARKFLSDAPGASLRGVASENWWPWFRLGEIYLNAAEAAFELNQEGVATTYINTLRERAGFPENSITDLNIEDIRKERRVELAFEDHRYFDLKRWRIAHEVWDGDINNEDAAVFALFPYRIVRPGHPDNNKYIFNKFTPTRFRRARFFRLGNYYASIDQGVLNNNPKLVRNPFH